MFDSAHIQISSEVLSPIAEIAEFKGAWRALGTLSPERLSSLRRVAADQTEWVPPNFLPTSGKGTLFLDELTSAPQMTQAGCFQLVLDRKLGEYVLPV
jgi:MoxR-like ATPase